MFFFYNFLSSSLSPLSFFLREGGERQNYFSKKKKKIEKCVNPLFLDFHSRFFSFFCNLQIYKFLNFDKKSKYFLSGLSNKCPSYQKGDQRWPKGDFFLTNFWQIYILSGLPNKCPNYPKNKKRWPKVTKRWLFLDKFLTNLCIEWITQQMSQLSKK